MKLHLLSMTLLLTTLPVPVVSLAEDGKHWGYEGDTGPAHWGQLSPDYETCATGKSQSPVNLTGFPKGKHPALTVDYQQGGESIFNNGHTVQVNYREGSSITVGGQTYALEQFHFHAPAENTIEGHEYPMEAHFVHADENGNLAVVALLYRVGKHKAELEKAWAHMPEHAGENHVLPDPIDANALLPRSYAYYRFDGSLTTPPCTEGVKWFVMAHADTASKEQIERFAKTMHHHNNRPVQPLNARVVTR